MVTMGNYKGPISTVNNATSFSGGPTISKISTPQNYGTSAIAKYFAGLIKEDDYKKRQRRIKMNNYQTRNTGLGYKTSGDIFYPAFRYQARTNKGLEYKTQEVDYKKAISGKYSSKQAGFHSNYSLN